MRTLKLQISNICYRAYNSFKYRILRILRIPLGKVLGMRIGSEIPQVAISEFRRVKDSNRPMYIMNEYWYKTSNIARYLFLSLFKACIYTISQKK